MSNSTTSISEVTALAKELSWYLHADAVEVVLSNMSTIEQKYNAQYGARLRHYQLPLGQLRLLELTLYLPAGSSSEDIDAARMVTLKAALAWHKSYLAQHTSENSVSHEVLAFDIQFIDSSRKSKAELNIPQQQPIESLKRLTHAFGARYFMEDLVVDMTDSVQQLQVFSWHDWQTVLEALQTPCELWRFLNYHLEQLQSSANNHVASFTSETELVEDFLKSSSLFTAAITVDNALIKSSIQTEPSSALVAMSLAAKNQSKTAQMYYQHMAQAASLWSQLSSQMIEAYRDNLLKINQNLQEADNDGLSDTDLAYWQQQLLDESLFSRHELVRTLYRHPKQGHDLQKDGYVVHQHSYESLGRHYVLIFYGQDVDGQNSKKVIQPNLAKIAQDVATRLPIVELHHVIVLGIEFITENDDTFIDIDLWIQPVNQMTQRERQLTKQIQQLKQQQAAQQTMNKPSTRAENSADLETQTGTANKVSRDSTQPAALPQVNLTLSIPARKNKP